MLMNLSEHFHFSACHKLTVMRQRRGGSVGRGNSSRRKGEITLYIGVLHHKYNGAVEVTACRLNGRLSVSAKINLFLKLLGCRLPEVME